MKVFFQLAYISIHKMSFNRTLYDKCAYEHRLNENKTTFTYVTDKNRFRNEDTKMFKFGLLGGPAVSHDPVNLIDLESELRGQTFLLSDCAKAKFNPKKNGSNGSNETNVPEWAKAFEGVSAKKIDLKQGSFEKLDKRYT